MPQPPIDERTLTELAQELKAVTSRAPQDDLIEETDPAPADDDGPTFELVDDDEPLHRRPAAKPQPPKPQAPKPPAAKLPPPQGARPPQRPARADQPARTAPPARRTEAPAPPPPLDQTPDPSQDEPQDLAQFAQEAAAPQPTPPPPGGVPVPGGRPGFTRASVLHNPGAASHLGVDCLKSLIFGFKNFGSIIVVLLVWLGVLFLTGVGLFLVNLLGAVTGSLIAALLALALQIIVILTVGAYPLRYFQDVIAMSVEGYDEAVPPPHWDLHEQFSLATRYVGVWLIYVIPIVTIPLLPLGLLAWAYPGDGRAFNLIWAARAALRNPLGLLLLWFMLLATCGVMILLMILASAAMMAAGLAALAQTDSTIVPILIGVAQLFVWSSLVLIAAAIWSRCVGLLGRHYPDVIEIMAAEPNQAISFAYVVAGVLMSAAVINMERTSLNHALNEVMTKAQEYDHARQEASMPRPPVVAPPPPTVIAHASPPPPAPAPDPPRPPVPPPTTAIASTQPDAKTFEGNWTVRPLGPGGQKLLATSKGHSSLVLPGGATDEELRRFFRQYGALERIGRAVTTLSGKGTNTLPPGIDELAKTAGVDADTLRPADPQKLVFVQGVRVSPPSFEIAVYDKTVYFSDQMLYVESTGRVHVGSAQILESRLGREQTMRENMHNPRVRPPLNPPPRPIDDTATASNTSNKTEWDPVGWREPYSLPTDHPFRKYCALILEFTVGAGRDHGLAGVTFGSPAKAKTDQAYIDFRADMRDKFKLFVAAEPGTNTKNELKQTWNEIEWDRLLAMRGETMLVAMVGVHNGRCAVYWFIGNARAFNEFTSAVGKARPPALPASAPATSEPATRP